MIEIRTIEDIYFNPAYIDLYLREGEENVKFSFSSGGSIFVVAGIKSPITKVGKAELEHSDYYDLSTAYGYGGYWTNSGNREFIQEAMQAFSGWCRGQGIIADFVRFHPLLFDATIFESEFAFFTRNNDTVVVDLNLSTEERWSTYSSGTRNILRRCQRELEVREATELDSFIALYYETMKRNAVGDFYYFDMSYFEKLLQIDEVRLWEVSYEGELASAGFFMYSDDIGHYHLSANNSSLSKHNANYLLLEHAIAYGRESGRKLFHLGGGRTPDPADGLFRFKKKFSPEGAVPFYIGGNVHNRDAYDELNALWAEQNHDDARRYFLKYRL